MRRTNRQSIRHATLFAVTILGLVLCPLLARPALSQISFGVDLRINSDPPGTSNHKTIAAGQRAVAAREDAVFVVWTDYRPDPDAPHVRLSRSLDGGQTFGADVQVDRHGSARSASIALGMAGEIYVVWQDQRDDPYVNVRFARSLDGGMSFGEDVRVDANGANPVYASAPSVATCPVTGNIYVAWQDGYPYVSRSTDGGNSFGPDVEINDLGVADPWTGDPVVAASPTGSVLVAWTDQRWIEAISVQVARSDDFGTTFGGSTTALWGREGPAMAISKSGIVYLAAGREWTDWPEGVERQAVFVSRSLDDGANFLGAVEVDERAVFPSLAVDGEDRLYLAFPSNPGSSSDRILFSFSPDGGVTFTDPVPVEDEDPEVYSAYPSIALNGGGSPCIAWSDNRDFGGGLSHDIYFDVGTFSTAVPVTAVMGQVEDRIRAFPNPTESAFSIQYRLPRREEARLEVFDVDGRRLRTISIPGVSLQGTLQAVTISGSGATAAPGVYFVRLITPERMWSTKVVLAE